MQEEKVMLKKYLILQWTFQYKFMALKFFWPK